MSKIKNKLFLITTSVFILSGIGFVISSFAGSGG